MVAPARNVGQQATSHVSGSSRSAATAVANGSAASGAASSGGAAASDLFTDGAWTLALCGKADYQGGSKTMSHHHETNDDVVRIKVEYDSCRSSVEIKGTVSFTRDFTAIERMESGSRLRIEVARDGEPDRRLEAHPGDDGRPEYRWWLDGRERSFDADARAWLSDALVDMFRSSSYLARERAAWIFSSGGASALFAEIQAMSSDHTQGIYLEALLENPAASTDDVRRAVGLAGSEIESDHALGKVLEAAATHSFDSATRDAWLAAARRIQSDHSQGKVFEAALARNDLSTANLGFILDAVAVDIESDHTKGKVYEGLLGHELSGQAMEMLIASSASIKSDHTLSKLLEKVIAEDIDEAQQIALLRVAKGIASDHSLGEVLEHFAGRYELSGRVAAAYDDAVSTIDSSHVRGKIARA